MNKCSNAGPPRLDATIENMPRLEPLPSATETAIAAATKRVRGVPADPQKFAVHVHKSAIDGQGAFAVDAVIEIV